MAYEFRGEETDHIDGLKVTLADRWIQARGSNTEPIIRLTAEAPTEPEARALIPRALDVLRTGR